MLNTNTDTIFVMESLDDFNNIRVGSQDTYYHYNDLIVKVRRVNNDMFGNPLYHVTLSKDYENMTYRMRGCSAVYRCYGSRGYCTVQSYNIQDSIKKMVTYLQKVTA